MYGFSYSPPTNQSFLDNIISDVAISITDDSQSEITDKIALALNSVGIKCQPEKIRKNSISGVKPNTIYPIVGSKLKSNR